TYGQARPDVARLYPDREAASRCGFSLTFDLPREEGGAIEPLLTVQTEDGEVGQHPLRVEIPEDRNSVAGEHRVTLRVDRQNPQTVDRLHIDSPRLIGGVAEAPVRGNLEIGGWAL